MVLPWLRFLATSRPPASRRDVGRHLSGPQFLWIYGASDPGPWPGHRPELAASLGADFWPAFQRYAAVDLTPPASTSSDAQRFARYVRKSRRSA